MGVFDKLKDRVTSALADQASKQAKNAARKGAEGALAVAKAAGRKLEEAVYGEREEAAKSDDAPKSTDSRSERKRKEESRKQKEADVGELLRAADRRVKERGIKEAELEKSLDDDMAALKKKLKK